jgi:triacylglycerol lipase
LLTRTLRLIILVVFCSIPSATNFPVKTADATPASNSECLFNWAQTFYPGLFSPLVSGVQFSSPYTYRYYGNTNSYVGVSSIDNHVYYLGPDDVSPQDVGDLAAWLTQSGCGARPYPIIFIHGLASSANVWIPYRNYLVNNGGWTFGGIPAYNQITKTVDINCPFDPTQLIACTGSAGDFYTLNFSDNQNLPFDVEGGELAATIKAVLDANPGKTKVLLVSHSMGGLAAREYLQGLAREANSITTIPYRDDVAKLITLGTPNQGIFWAEACHNHLDLFHISSDADVCDRLFGHLDPDSIRIDDLMPNSPALNILNDLNAHPLPANISYVSIIGTGQPTLTGLFPVDFKAGDGMVCDFSQDLMMLTANLPQQKSVRIDIPFGECATKIDVPSIGSFAVTHGCETTDLGVGGEVLRNLQ